MKPFTLTAAVIFLLMALVHLYRVTLGIPITVGAMSIGQEVSWVGLIVALILAIGLFREARGSEAPGLLPPTSHDILLLAVIDRAHPNQIIVTRKEDLPRGSTGHHFKFSLDDRTGKEVTFDRLMATDNWSTCPPDPTKPSTQIWDPKIDNNPRPGQPRTAGFKNKNDNNGPIDVAYQWEFTCNDPTFTVLPFDPVITNRGR